MTMQAVSVPHSTGWIFKHPVFGLSTKLTAGEWLSAQSLYMVSTGPVRLVVSKHRVIMVPKSNERVSKIVVSPSIIGSASEDTTAFSDADRFSVKKQHVNKNGKYRFLIRLQFSFGRCSPRFLKKFVTGYLIIDI